MQQHPLGVSSSSTVEGCVWRATDIATIAVVQAGLMPAEPPPLAVACLLRASNLAARKLQACNTSESALSLPVLQGVGCQGGGGVPAGHPGGELGSALQQVAHAGSTIVRVCCKGLLEWQEPRLLPRPWPPWYVCAEPGSQRATSKGPGIQWHPPPPALPPCLPPPKPPPRPQALLHPNSTQVRRAGANTTASSIRPGSLREQLAQTDNSTLAAGDVALLLLDAPVDSALPVAIATTEQWEGELQMGELAGAGWRGPLMVRGRGSGLMPCAEGLLHTGRCAGYESP